MSLTKLERQHLRESQVKYVFINLLSPVIIAGFVVGTLYRAFAAGDKIAKAFCTWIGEN